MKSEEKLRKIQWKHRAFSFFLFATFVLSDIWHSEKNVTRDDSFTSRLSLLCLCWLRHEKENDKGNDETKHEKRGFVA